MQLKNHLFYSEIFKVDLNDINDCIYLLYFKSTFFKDTPFYYTDVEFTKLLSRKEIIDFTDNLRKIIEDESFIKDLKEILNQKSIKDYFEKSKLKNGFERFMNYINNDTYIFSKLFIIKYLPKYVRADVDPNLRIIINPLYFELSDTLDEEKKNEVFKAYLFVIILNEISNLVKFMEEKSIQNDNIPQTHKNKKGGNMFIYHLFNTPIIYSINYKQALVINKPENWNKPEILCNIFKEQRKWYEENKKDKKEDVTLPPPKKEDTNNFYLSFVDDDNDEQVTNNVIDIWYDID